MAEGRYTPAQADSIRRAGREIEDMLEAGTTWWDPAWAAWTPPDDWTGVDLPAGG